MEKLGPDLRDMLDVSENGISIQRKLQLYFPPGEQHDSGQNDLDTRGLDCLIVLIRHIYSYLLPLYSDKEERKDAERRNPLLAMAWVHIDSDQKRVWAAGKQSILKLLNSHCAREPQTSFLSLVNSPLMKETFWHDDEHILYRACLIMPDGAPWENVDLGENPIDAMANMSTVVVDRMQKPTRSFQKLMETPFKLTKTRTSKRLRLCAEPAVIRVHYKTSKDLEPFPFTKLKEFYLPIQRIDRMDSSEPLPEPKECVYSLIALVSLQEQRIRTYKFLGGEISQCSYTGRGRRWSLEDKIDGEFMLFYLRAGSVAYDHEIPEIASVPRDGRTFPFLNKFFDDCKRADEEKNGG
ncbi:hypothetical protein H9Q70_009862 [Fusarium xylarioides]|nr:hypothetical protein H9Q70_009862 [Fusarium xylarioides]KAG5776511.1 hypothetical protein H9Q73_009809 [Fusarium xylarioides]